ncbi:thyrotropin-releasing hormone receptor isoform X2 [Eurytemora carolleeae]|uniref:thyrotropin-releasing hormone receptor isoform X2 n=1 Tax=Eurytemora carolleeae TaxID=1294199 RepID=UPI000C789FD3|nr:thyrotropin-releasing hormone receptor isoform X2 [Eurytemora carolleeae]|eukprot:XP_023349197.1 thyrotropin-releasing hormone receptor-like isoform X2 [Eurytemora affinis]
MRGNGSGWDIFPTSGSNPEWNVSSTLERTPENEFQDDLELNLSSLEWNSTSNCSTPEMYDDLFKYSGTVFQSFVFLIGILGNMIVIITVMNTKSLHNTTNSYLVSLALADLITLLSSCPQEIISYHMLGDKWIWGPVGCSSIIYLQYLGINVSALSLTAFTVERYIAICHPMKAQYICTPSRAKRIIMYCWMFAIVYCFPWIFLVHVEDSCIQGFGKISKCKWKMNRSSVYYKILFFSDIILFYVIPLVLTSILYSLIALVLIRSRNGEILTSTSKARVQVIKMLAAVVIVFACLWIPYRPVRTSTVQSTLFSTTRCQQSSVGHSNVYCLALRTILFQSHIIILL